MMTICTKDSSWIILKLLWSLSYSIINNNDQLVKNSHFYTSNWRSSEFTLFKTLNIFFQLKFQKKNKMTGKKKKKKKKNCRILENSHYVR